MRGGLNVLQPRIVKEQRLFPSGLASRHVAPDKEQGLRLWRARLRDEAAKGHICGVRPSGPPRGTVGTRCIPVTRRGHARDAVVCVKGDGVLALVRDVWVAARADVKGDRSVHQVWMLPHELVAHEATPVVNDEGGVHKPRSLHRGRELVNRRLKRELFQRCVREIRMKVLPCRRDAPEPSRRAVAQPAKLCGKLGSTVGPAVHEEESRLCRIAKRQRRKRGREVGRHLGLHAFARR
mmetsp:Transcript_48238/g.159856  ORF Transcript_48238/g.159856 Transcript_48238/m.159856 type:complete len:237 (+) Transcript_48238:220-930(+)